MDKPTRIPAGSPQQQTESDGTLTVDDAISFIDSVKLQFASQPEVYDTFLDIMKDFQTQVIDTPEVIERISNLFHGHTALIKGFNIFLPTGYRIETSDDADLNAITTATPDGTIAHATDPASQHGTLQTMTERMAEIAIFE